MDVLFGMAVMGTVGTLIGIIMGGGIMPLASGAGLVLGGFIGLMGGRRFLASILVGALLGGALAWFIAGPERISVGAGPAPPWVGFSVCRFRCCWICARQRRRLQPEEYKTRWKIRECSSAGSCLSLGRSS